MKIIELNCVFCNKVIIIGQKIVGLDTGERVIIPLHAPCAQKLKDSQEGSKNEVMAL